MMLSVLFATASLLVQLGSAGICLEKVQAVPAGWQKLNDEPSPAQKYSFSIALHQPRMHELDAKVESASKSPLSREQIRALRAPDEHNVDSVMQWLDKHGIHGATQKDGWIKVHTTVGKAEKLLNMKLARYAFGDRFRVLRSQEYSIPNDLSGAISFVHPVSNFMSPEHGVLDVRPLSKNQILSVRSENDEAPCATVATPGCIRKLYNITFNSDEKTSSARLAIAGFLEQYANYNDTQTFLQRTAPSIKAAGYNFTTELVNGGQNSQKGNESGLEAALDMDYALALAYPINLSFISTGGRGEKLDDKGKPVEGNDSDNEPYVELFQNLLDKPDHEFPHVLSMSYADDELSVPRRYADRVCEMLGMLSSRGMTILVGSGDGGAKGGGINSLCRTNDGSNKDVAMATFPGTCKWATAVGATEGRSEPPNGATFSGGGFSQYYERPDWQSEAVEGYVEALGGHLDGFYNKNMRALPDISAIGTAFMTIMDSKPQAVDGTSASTPVIASMIALVNHERLKAGKPAIGWINKLLYSEKVRAVLQDVTGGESMSCEFKDGSQPGGWPSKKGWDAITGLGVPKDFQAFLKVLVDA